VVTDSLSQSRRPREQWLNWGLRAAVLCLALPFLLVGVVTSVRTVHNAGLSRPPAASAVATDRGQEAFGARFAVDYLTYDESKQDDYRFRMGQYLSPSADPMAGWDGKGRQSAGNPFLVSSRPGPSGVRLVTVAVETGTGWTYVAVPVAGSGAGFVVTAPPTIVPSPAVAAWTAPDGRTDVDPGMSSSRMGDLSAFFKAFGAGSLDLAYFEAPGATLAGLGGRLELDRLDRLLVYQGGEQRDAIAQVRWKDGSSGGSYSQTYRLRLVQTGNKWLVSSLEPAVTNGVF
jgi:hypothetical protein